jgi:hypothetical protein
MVGYNLRIVLISAGLLLLTVAAVVFAPQVDPVFIAAQEPNGSDVPVDSAISITFSRAVEQHSAERAFVIYPVVRGRFGWEDDLTMIFTPAEQLQPQTSYRIIVRAGVRDSRGRPTRSETSWPFRTGE